MLSGRHRAANIASGAVVLVVMVAAIGAAVAALLAAAVGPATQQSALYDAYIWRVTRFTLLQATLSTGLSVALAVPLARAIARRQHFPGRDWLIRLLAVPLGLPPIIAALGLIEIWGRQGIISTVLSGLGLTEPLSIYGLPGILLAHVFFNLPLATRLLLAALDRVPAEYWRNADQLGLGARSVFTAIEWPFMRSQIAGIAGLVFMLCVTSFTLVLLLGGGPAATTLEVAIYQALRFDFDPPRAVGLAVMQLVLTGGLLAALAMINRSPEEAATLGQPSRRHPDRSMRSRLADYGLIAVASLFLMSPLLSIAISGLTADLPRLVREPIVWRAILTSLGIGLCAAILSVTAALALVRSRHAALQLAQNAAWARLFRSAAATVSSLVLLVPPIVLGAGWFVLMRGRADVFALAPILVILINAIMALPFVMRVLEPAHMTHMARTERLSIALGLTGMRRLVLVDWPGLRRALLLALAFAMALSLGDLGAIALFGSQDVVTLPYLLLQRMGSYRTNDAAGLALILGLMCLLLMVFAGRGDTAKQTGLGT